jgi:hypothetical protein
MNPYGISLVVLLGSLIGLYLCFPQARLDTLIAFGIINGVFALFASVIGVYVLRSLGMLPDERR